MKTLPIMDLIIFYVRSDIIKVNHRWSFLWLNLFWYDVVEFWRLDVRLP